jgi:hypothetical protein
MEVIKTQDERQGLPSASALWLVARCPGSWSLGQQVDRDVSEAMRDGIDTHARIEALLRGEQYEGRPRDEATAEQRARAELIIAKKAEEAVQALRHVLEQSQMQHAQWAVETRYWIYWQDRKIGSAKPDYICLDPRTGRLLVVDFKTISNPHASMLEDIGEAADKSWQMWAAVTGYIDQYLSGDVSQVRHARLVYIKIPLYNPEGPIECEDSDWIGHETVVSKIMTVKALFMAAIDDDATLIPGWHCKWCRAKHVCVARLQGFLLGAGQSGRAMLQSNPRLASIIMHYRSDIEAMIEGAKSVLLSLPDDELEELGWRKAPPAKHEQITDTVTAFNALRDRGLGEEVLLRCCNMSVSSLVKEVAMAFEMSEGEARDYIASALAYCLKESVDGTPRLLKLKGARKPSLNLYTAESNNSPTGEPVNE